MKRPDKVIRLVTGVSFATALLCFYLFQDSFQLQNLDGLSAESRFILVKTGRFLINDLLMLGVIYSIFGDRKILLVALIVQLVGTVFLFLPYLILKTVFHTDNGPMVSFLHRITVNPVLLLLLIPAIWIQRRNADHGIRNC